MFLLQYSGIRIGPVVKKDVMKASIMLEHDSQWVLYVKIIVNQLCNLVIFLGMQQSWRLMWKSKGMRKNWPILWAWRYSRLILFIICLINSRRIERNWSRRNAKSLNTSPCFRVNLRYYRSLCLIREIPSSSVLSSKPVLLKTERLFVCQVKKYVFKKNIDFIRFSNIFLRFSLSILVL